MRILIISDIHANLVALEAVLKDADGQYDAVWCLGDLVGYGPNPSESVQRVRDLPAEVCTIGNHDVAALGRIPPDTFNVDAQFAIGWTQAHLTDDAFTYLDERPDRVVKEPFTLVHASPRDPVWEYILDRYIAMQNFSYFDTDYCLVGHTHTPVYYRLNDGMISENLPEYDHPVDLNSGGRYIINPGSVGQPRDNNPLAAYGLLDTDAMVWTFKRIPYNIQETQRRMLLHDMPMRLVTRLAHGW